MAFRSVFIATFIAAALVIAALILHRKRPDLDLAQPTAALVRSTGKCAECHRRETAAVVHQFDRSRHANRGIVCLDCHRPVEGQDPVDHKGFVISASVTAKNCAECHAAEYEQFLRSRHGAPAWAAVAGEGDFLPEQVRQAETYHPGAVRRPPNALAQLEGEAAVAKGCAVCHNVGRPNADGSIGTCTHCHSRHNASVALARQPETCGQCHMGPDHSQLEIYNESKHGVLFNLQKLQMNLAAPPKELTTEDMPVPTCATCHMSGLDGKGVTHDVTERLSWWLFQAVSQRRPTYAQGQAKMQDLCLTCHTAGHVETFYAEAEAVVDRTNEIIGLGRDLVDSLRAEGVLSPTPFDEPIEYLYFDFWHYFGRTAKHGAFMGGADFVQWHGNYELQFKLAELREKALQLRRP